MKYEDVIKVKEVRSLDGDTTVVNELLKQGWRIFPKGVIPTQDRYGRPSFFYCLFLTREAQQRNENWP